MSTPSAKQPTAVPIANTELHELTSACVGQRYLMKVRLPETYMASTETFPVLYLLDGDHAFAMATDIVQYLIYGQHIPDLIIASPAYGSKSTPEYGGTNMRNRDLLPVSPQGSDTPSGSAAFLQFFEQEFIPFIEANYRVNTTKRTFAGYSSGGVFVLYTLFQNPKLFHHYIVIDGFDAWFFAREAAFAAENQNLPVTLFVADGNDDSTEFIAKLQGRGYPDLKIEHAQLSPLGHFAIGAEGLTKGLIAVFRP
jgi:uncharacterized protein